MNQAKEARMSCWPKETDQGGLRACKKHGDFTCGFIGGAAANLAEDVLKGGMYRF